MSNVSSTLCVARSTNYMSVQEPLPLIAAPGEHADFEPLSEEESRRLTRYGYALVALTYVLFLVSINSMFKCWHWVILPLSWLPDTLELHAKVRGWCETFDYVVISLWCIYVVGWWWALFSWIGLKLFRQSKGIQS